VIDDALWSAIGDPTRRRVLDLLVRGPATPTTLGENLPVSRQAVTKHLKVLTEVGLVTAGTTGRERRYHVDVERLRRATGQVADVATEWDARLHRIKDLAETLHRSREDEP
jgi:ArsR family transcriptional regulator, cadmium/lead-responsive transcriptional repressor